jgi:hypothetical protein
LTILNGREGGKAHVVGVDLGAKLTAGVHRIVAASFAGFLALQAVHDVGAGLGVGLREFAANDPIGQPPRERSRRSVLTMRSHQVLAHSGVPVTGPPAPKKLRVSMGEEKAHSHER